jgi:hypothetical protein
MLDGLDNPRFNHRVHGDHGENLLKASVDSVFSVVEGFLVHPFIYSLK